MDAARPVDDGDGRLGDAERPEAEPPPPPPPEQEPIRMTIKLARRADRENGDDDDSDDWRAFATRVRAATAAAEADAPPPPASAHLVVPERVARPLEIDTFDHHPPSGQESPRIIIKINKTSDGPTSELVTDRTRSPTVPKLTIKLPEHDAQAAQAVCPIKLKLSKEDGRATIVGRRPGKSGPKRTPLRPAKVRRLDESADDAFDYDDLSEVTPSDDGFVELDESTVDSNDRSSSRDCVIVDELSQDPLDVGSAARAHFAPQPQPHPPTATPVTPRKRGRPRKVPPTEPIAPATPIGETAERTLRRSKIIRQPTVIRTPRGRGRGRGRGRHSNADTPVPQRAFFPRLELVAPVEMRIEQVDLVEPLPVSEENEHKPESDVESLSSDSSSDEAPSPVELSDDVSVRGRGRGRGSGRGSRRGRGGRTPRSTRGARNTPRINRVGKFYEEVQVQDTLPVVKSVRHTIRKKVSAANTPSIELFEEETCMIGDNDTPLRNTTLLDEESQNSEVNTRDTVTSKPKKSSYAVDTLDECSKDWTAADVAEYDWPPEGCTSDSPPQTYMIQEQVALYLGIKSFKRKYPDLHRRTLEPEERTFLLGRGLVTEHMCNLGITAVDAGEVLDIMFTDFPTKYEEYRQHLRETRDTRTANKPPPQLTTERSKQETMERAVQSASTWNSRFNRQRRTMRSATVDLQTLTLHRPRKPQTVADSSSQQMSYYPVALLPGQYTDYYRHYTPEELRFFPLSTVLNSIQSPLRVEEGADSQSEESAEDSDAVDSSSEASDSESSERNFKRRNQNAKTKKIPVVVNDISRPTSPSANLANSQPVPSPLPPPPPPPVEVPRCKLCNGTEHANRRYPSETFITCATCHKKLHPSCLEMTQNVAKCVRLYAWQCPDCKCCARCEDLADDDKMLFCDLCDRGYHIYCVGLKRVPTGRWHCSHCAICRSCGARSPSGLSDKPTSNGPPDQWHHHLKKTSSGTKIYSHTLCGPCARAWRAGRYCSLCERCFMGKKGALKVVICVNCDRTHHKECVKQPGRTLDVLNYMCNSCRRGNTPRRYTIPRKKAIRRTPLSNNNAVQNSNRNSLQTEAISMDLSVDSLCTNDSNHQSNSTCDGPAYEETNSSKPPPPNHATPLKETENRIAPRRLITNSVQENNTSETSAANSLIQVNSLSNNHVKDTNDKNSSEQQLVNNIPKENKINSINNINALAADIPKVNNDTLDMNDTPKKSLMKALSIGSGGDSTIYQPKVNNDTSSAMDLDVQYGNDNRDV